MTVWLVVEIGYAMWWHLRCLRTKGIGCCRCTTHKHRDAVVQCSTIWWEISAKYLNNFMCAIELCVVEQFAPQERRTHSIRTTRLPLRCDRSVHEPSRVVWSHGIAYIIITSHEFRSRYARHSTCAPTHRTRGDSLNGLEWRDAHNQK